MSRNGQPASEGPSTAKPGNDLYGALLGRWLKSYSRLARQTPALADRLHHRSDEFVLVPIPKQLLAHLSDDEPSISSEGEASAALRDFLEHVARGESEAAADWLHPDYLDRDGRRAAEARTAIETLIAGSDQRRLTLESLSELAGGGATASVVGTGRWCCREGEGRDLEERFSIDATLCRHDDGAWRITSLTTREVA